MQLAGTTVLYSVAIRFYAYITNNKTRVNRRFADD